MATAAHRRVEADDTPGPVKAIEDVTKVIDEVPQGVDYKKLFADEKFMNEYVPIMLHPTQDLSEVGVPISVNGLRVYLTPGRPQRIRRLFIAQLVKARPDIVIHRSDDPYANEADLNRMYKQSTSRYNFDVLEDTAKGAAWLRELKLHYMQK